MIIRIGRYTGKDYTDSYNTFLCPECCVTFADRNNVLTQTSPSVSCGGCTNGCPARVNNLSLASPPAVWDKAILETFQFVGHKAI